MLGSLVSITERITQYRRVRAGRHGVPVRYLVMFRKEPKYSVAFTENDAKRVLSQMRRSDSKHARSYWLKPTDH
jgi:hypothetical protein